MTSAAAVALRTPQINSPGSNSSDEHSVPDTVVEMTKALLVAHPSVEKSTTSGDNIVPKDPGGGLCAATPITNALMTEREVTDGCDDFPQTVDGNNCDENDNVKQGGDRVESPRNARIGRNFYRWNPNLLDF